MTFYLDSKDTKKNITYLEALGNNIIYARIRPGEVDHFFARGVQFFSVFSETF